MLQRSDSLDHSTALSLDNIRQSLIRQEDTIIFSLIERAQFAANEPVSQSGAIAVPGKPPPMLQCMTLCTDLWKVLLPALCEFGLRKAVSFSMSRSATQ